MRRPLEAQRRTLRLVIVGAACGAVGAGQPARAQPAPDTDSTPSAVPAPTLARTTGIGLWGGVGTHSRDWGVLGAVPNVNLALAAARLSWPVGPHARHHVSRQLYYTVDLIPVALLSPPYISHPRGSSGCSGTRVCIQPAPGSTGHGLFPSGSAYGAGASPLGLTTVFRADDVVRPTLGATGGMLWFDRRVPTTEAARRNFTATLEAGLDVAPRRGPAVSVGYKFHHLSNGGTARENPAVASNMVSVAISWRRASP